MTDIIVNVLACCLAAKHINWFTGKTFLVNCGCHSLFYFLQTISHLPLVNARWSENEEHNQKLRNLSSINLVLSILKLMALINV
jgi:hypothetical protein